MFDMVPFTSFRVTSEMIYKPGAGSTVGPLPAPKS
jgi:hypothetical protein